MSISFATELDPNPQVTVHLTEDFDTYDQGSVTLNYSLNGGADVQVAMADMGGDTYRAALPGAACFDTYDYFVSATTDARATRSPPTPSTRLWPAE